MIYSTNIDIMFGERFHATIRNYTVNTLFGGGRMLSDMIEHIYKVKPYLQRRPDFDLYFKNKENQEIHLTIKPKQLCQ